MPDMPTSDSSNTTGRAVSAQALANRNRGDARTDSRSARSREQFARYLEHYDFVRDPFSDAGISGLFFSGGGRRQTLESLQHYLRYGSSPVFLTGPIGSGKTTTLNAFLGELESDVDCSLVASVLMMTPGQFFSRVTSGFGIEQTGDGTMDLPKLMQLISDFVEANGSNERQSLICVDNVQDLSQEVINAVFELLANTPGLQLLMVGEQQAKSMLEIAAEKSNVLLNPIELPVFNQQDVSAYLRYRLDSVGYAGEFPLSDMQLQALSHRSQGSLNQLHHVARSMLTAGIDGGKQTLSPFPLTHLFALVLLTLLIIIGWRHEESQAPAVEQPIQLEQVTRTDSSGIAITEQAVQADAGIQTQQSHNTATQLEQSALDASKTLTQVRKALGRLEESSSVAGLQDKQMPEADTQATALVDMPASVSMVIANGEAAAETVAAPVNNSGVEQAVVDINPTEQPLDLTESSAAPGNGDSVVASEASSTTASTVGSVNSAHKRLMAWSEVGYALQIFGTHNAKRAKQLVDEYFGDADLLFYETRHNGKPWFVVVNGPYSGREAAKLSIEALPESLQRLRPWPRNIASIQSDIRRYGAAIAADQ